LIGRDVEPLRLSRPYWTIPPWTIAQSPDEGETIWQCPRDCWFGHGQFWVGHIKGARIEANFYAFLLYPDGGLHYIGGQYMHKHADALALDFHPLQGLSEDNIKWIPAGTQLVIYRSCANIDWLSTIAWDFEICIQTYPGTAEIRKKARMQMMVRRTGRSRSR